MPLEELSHFDEKSGVIPCSTPWGKWWQTVAEVHIEVNLPQQTRAKNVKVVGKPNFIECVVHGNTIFKVNISLLCACLAIYYVACRLRRRVFGVVGYSLLSYSRHFFFCTFQDVHCTMIAFQEHVRVFNVLFVTA